MCLPHIEEIVHAAGDILPALDVLGTAFFVEPEGLLIERGVVAGLAQMIPGLPCKLGEHFQHPGLVRLNPGDVLIAQVEALEQFGGEDFELGFENVGAEMKKFFEFAGIGGERFSYEWGFIGLGVLRAHPFPSGNGI